MGGMPRSEEIEGYDSEKIQAAYRYQHIKSHICRRLSEISALHDLTLLSGDWLGSSATAVRQKPRGLGKLEEAAGNRGCPTASGMACRKIACASGDNGTIWPVTNKTEQ